MSATFRDVLLVFYRESQLKHKDITTLQYTLKTEDNQNEKVIGIYVDDKKMLSSKYEVLGIYDNNTNLFIWGSHIKPSNANENIRVKDIKEYSTKLKSMILNTKFSDVGYMEKMLYYLSENIIYIMKENIIELIMLTTFVSKKLVIGKSEKDVLTLYLLTDVLSY